MPLPILNNATEPTPENLVRLFHRTELHWVRHLGEETQLDCGVAFTNAQLPAVWDANLVIDAALPPGMSPAQAFAEVDAHFRSAGTRCLQWLMNPSAPAAQVLPLVDHLRSRGWEPRPYDVMHLTAGAAPASPDAPGLTIIPARASFRHARSLADEAASCWGEPQLAEASMLHLDDPHWDVSIALFDGRAVARAGVLTVGDLGRIEHVFVSEPFRRRGIGRTMMGRALEVCARSLFKHVMLCVPPDERPAVAMYSRFGFRRIGQMIPFRQPPAGA
jgi:ribosomal protein S18 acetylase RimI-like enzyme